MREPRAAAIVVAARACVLPIIGDCEEQTGERIEYNIERFTRMARDYGWRRQ